MRRKAAAGMLAGGMAAAALGWIALAPDGEGPAAFQPPPPPAEPIVPGGSETPRGAALYTVHADGSNLRRAGDGDTFFRGPVWSPDGRRIAVTASTPGEQPLPRGRVTARIEVRAADGRLVRRFSTKSSLSLPAWSPDSERLAFVDPDLEAIVRGRGGRGTPLVVATVATGASRAVSRRAQRSSGRPDWSPDGRWIVFPSAYAGEPIPGGPPGAGQPPLAQPELTAVDPDGGRERRLTRDPARHRLPRGSDEEIDPRWLDEHRLFFVSFVTPPDPRASRRLRVLDVRRGRPRTVASVHWAIPAASPDGRRVAFSGVVGGAGLLRLLGLDVESRDLVTLAADNVVERPTWSPDGDLVAFAIGDRVDAVRPDGRGRRTIVRVPGREVLEVAWSPDGRRLAFTTGPTRREPTAPGPPVSTSPTP